MVMLPSASSEPAPMPAPSNNVDTDFLTDAVEAHYDAADGANGVEVASAEFSDSTEAVSELAEEGDISPPPGALGYDSAEEATAVEEEEPQQFERSTPKQRPDNAEPGLADAVEVPDWRQLSFSSSTFTPEPGIDNALMEAADISIQSADERSSTYGFLITEQLLSQEIEGELEALGVTVLGNHDSAFKVKLPLDGAQLEAINELPYVYWIGYSLPEQKLSPELQDTVVQFSEEVNELPIIINLFEGDDSGEFAEQLESAGVSVGEYDPDLVAYTGVATNEVIDSIIELDFVLFVEVEQQSGPGHDESTSSMGIDYIRTGGGGTNFSGASTRLGILDTGFMLGAGAATMHNDLNKNGCGRNFTSDSAGVWNDQNGHGTHVLGTIVGTGSGDSRFRGVATGVGGSGSTRIRAAKIWGSTNTGQNSWMRSAMDYMDDDSGCGTSKPQVINISGGARGTGQTGTDSNSRKLDSKVWTHKQAYIVCSGNSGPGAQTIWNPGVAKNALTVGNVRDNAFGRVGDINNSSSRGPTGDGRMKPNIVGAGTTINSARAGTTNQYTGMNGCSMATPHVSGIAATLLEHYPEFRNRPYLLRAHLMATSIPHDNVTTPANNTSGGRNTYGLGRVSTYAAHWARNNRNGWTTHRAWRTITDKTWGFRDITVPNGTKRLVVVMTWDEPAASSGASQAVTHDLDLWVDYKADCTPDAKGQCGEWTSQSSVDNTEYLVINNPQAGTYRLKMVNWRAPSSGLPAAIAAMVVRGDPTPPMSLRLAASNTRPAVGSTFRVTARVNNPAYIASGVHLGLTGLPSGLSLVNVSTTREDGISMTFRNRRGITLGNIIQGDSRSAVYTFRVNSSGTKTLNFRAWSENGGTRTSSIQIRP